MVLKLWAGSTSRRRNAKGIGVLRATYYREGLTNPAGGRKSALRSCFDCAKVPMRLILVVLCSLCLLASGFAQDNASSSHAALPALGLEVGRQAPAFSSTDQFGEKQSNASMKGNNGTVLLFFRSADW